MPAVPLQDLSDHLTALAVRRRKPVGFGMSRAAEYLYPLKPVYYVYPRRTLISALDGLDYWQQQPLDALKREDPAKTSIIVYEGSVDDAMEQLGPYSHFPVVPFFAYEYIQAFFPLLQHLPLRYERRRKLEKAKRAIVIRGQVKSETEVAVIQYLAATHPDDLIIVSTWEDTDALLKARVASVADRVVLVKKPALPPSDGYRNWQLACIRPALAAAQEMGAEKTLLTRTDMLIGAQRPLEILDALHVMTSEHGKERRKGLRGRLVIHNLLTRLYVPYHFSDILTYGYTEDVARYWCAPDDPRSKEDLMTGLKEKSFRQAQQERVLVETYFGSHFVESLGITLDYSLRQHYELIRDLFCVIDHRALDVLWTKKYFFDRTIGENGLKTLIPGQMWWALQQGAGFEHANAVQLDQLPYLAYMET